MLEVGLKVLPAILILCSGLTLRVKSSIRNSNKVLETSLRQLNEEE